MYLWIFLGSYIAAFCFWFFHMSQKMGAFTEQLRFKGLEEAEIKEFYRSMGGMTLVTLIWSTVFTGSIIGGIISLIYWVAQRE